MNQPESLEEFVKLASQFQGDRKTLYVNQSDYTPEEEIVSDEDTAGGNTMQMIRLLASSTTDATYWEEPVYDSGELEQLNIQLDSLDTFSREVLTLQDMEKNKSHFDI
ncbi:hypothetical protein ABE021_03325 [Sporosarcina gallistercoris]|uniref:hypothetical protein n=1 Tax=Sporosarcina gallistercoris TaxID=2762245 RepID=UPI003D2A77E9